VTNALRKELLDILSGSIAPDADDVAALGGTAPSLAVPSGEAVTSPHEGLTLLSKATPTATKAAPSTDKAKAAQRARAKTYGIAPKADGNVTMPARWRRAGVSVNQFADPVNFAYPVHDEEHANNAMARFSQNKDRYSSAEQAIVRRRITAAQKRFGVSTAMSKTQQAPAAPDADTLAKQTATATMDPSMMTTTTGTSDYPDETGEPTVSEDDPLWVAMEALLAAALAYLKATDAMSEAAGQEGVTREQVSTVMEQIKTGALVLWDRFESGAAEDTENAAALAKSVPWLAAFKQFGGEQDPADLLTKRAAPAPDAPTVKAANTDAAPDGVLAEVLTLVKALTTEVETLKKHAVRDEPPAADPPTAAAATSTAIDPEADEDVLRKRAEIADLEVRRTAAQAELDDVLSKVRPRPDDRTDGWNDLATARGEYSTEELQNQLLHS
jgi:hypothetical protein